jgi:hypothetical protein
MITRPGARVFDVLQPWRVGVILERARCHHAWVVQWEYGGCSVVAHYRLAPPDLELERALSRWASRERGA